MLFGVAQGLLHLFLRVLLALSHFLDPQVIRLILGCQLTTVRVSTTVKQPVAAPSAK
ncbi:hypothetical protein XACM_1060 [Xanthomonas euvesicatoria pv. citrumelo F1]|nr:hypothetical protein XACM_1060 [Xanthomonas euvesicatoria pv. citrumelo F1]